VRPEIRRQIVFSVLGFLVGTIILCILLFKSYVVITVASWGMELNNELIQNMSGKAIYNHITEDYTISVLKKKLHSKNHSIRYWAFYLLREGVSKRPLPDALLEDAVNIASSSGDDRMVRKAAFSLLREVASKRPLPDALVDDLINIASSDADSGMRLFAIWGLRKCAQEKAFQTLLRSLQDPNWEVRGHACTELGLRGDHRALMPMTETLEKEKDWRVRHRCIDALGDLGDSEAIPVIEGVVSLPSSDLRIKIECYWALIRLGELDYLINLVESYEEAKESDEDWARVWKDSIVSYMGWFSRYYLKEYIGMPDLRGVQVSAFRKWLSENRERIVWFPDIRKYGLASEAEQNQDP